MGSEGSLHLGPQSMGPQIPHDLPDYPSERKISSSGGADISGLLVEKAEAPVTSKIGEIEDRTLPDLPSTTSVSPSDQLAEGVTKLNAAPVPMPTTLKATVDSTKSLLDRLKPIGKVALIGLAGLLLVVGKAGVIAGGVVGGAIIGLIIALRACFYVVPFGQKFIDWFDKPGSYDKILKFTGAVCSLGASVGGPALFNYATDGKYKDGLERNEQADKWIARIFSAPAAVAGVGAGLVGLPGLFLACCFLLPLKPLELLEGSNANPSGKTPPAPGGQTSVSAVKDDGEEESELSSREEGPELSVREKNPEDESEKKIDEFTAERMEELEIADDPLDSNEIDLEIEKEELKKEELKEAELHHEIEENELNSSLEIQSNSSVDSSDISDITVERLSKPSIRNLEVTRENVAPSSSSKSEQKEAEGALKSFVTLMKVNKSGVEDKQKLIDAANTLLDQLDNLWKAIVQNKSDPSMSQIKDEVALKENIKAKLEMAKEGTLDSASKEMLEGLSSLTDDKGKLNKPYDDVITELKELFKAK